MKKMAGIFVISCFCFFGFHSLAIANVPTLINDVANDFAYELIEMADLSFSAFALTDSELTYTIENTGTKAALGKVRMQWVDEDYSPVDDKARTYWVQTEIQAGDTLDIALSLTTEDSALAEFLANPHFNARYLHLLVDPDDEVMEVDDANNHELVPLSLADLSFSSTALTDAELTYTIENTGTKAALGKVRMQWVDEDYLPVDDKARTYWVQTEIQAGDTLDIALSLTTEDSALAEFLANPSSDAKYIHLLVDPDDEVMEIDEANNSELVSVALADLSFSSTALTDAELTYTIENTGTKAALGKVRMQWVDEDYLAVDTNARTYWVQIEIQAGGTLDIALSLTTEDSALAEFLANPHFNARYLHLLVDPNDEVMEADDANNHELVPLALANLSFSSVVLTSTKLAYTIENNGTKAAVGKVRMQWVDEDYLPIDDNARTFWHMDAIPAGETSDVFLGFSTTDSSLAEFLDNPPVDAQYLHLLLDPDNDVMELNETDNHELVMPLVSGVTGLSLLDLDNKLVIKKLDTIDPKLLPDSKLYFVKSAGRFLKSALTFSPRKQADLNRRYANEIIVEVSKLVEKGSVDEVADHLQRYEEEIVRVEKMMDTLQEQDSDYYEEFIFGSTHDQINHQYIVSRVKEGTSGELVAAVIQTQDRALVHLERVLNHVEESQKLEFVIKDAFDDEGSPFRPLQTLDVVRFVEQVISRSGQEVLALVEADLVDRFSSQLDALSSSEQQFFVEYVDKAGGDDITYQSILDDVVLEEISEETRSILENVDLELSKTTGRQTAAVEDESEDESVEEVRLEVSEDVVETQREEIDDSSNVEVVEEVERFDEVIDERVEEVEEDVVETEREVVEEEEAESERVTEEEEEEVVVDDSESDRSTVEEEVVSEREETILVEEEEEEETVVEERDPETVVVEEEEEAVVEEVCDEDTWECGDWSECSAEGSQTRSCRMTNDCSEVSDRSPDTQQSCTPPVVEEEEEETESRSGR
jgi:hypothetical protein